MSNLFVILFLLSLVLFVWGLVKPSYFRRFSDKLSSRKKVSGWFGGAVLLFFVLIGVTAPKTNVSQVKLDNIKTPSVLSSSDKKVSEKAKSTTETIIETQEIPFQKKTVNDNSLDKGVLKVTTIGANGTRTLTYSVTKLDGKVTDKKLIKDEVTTNPVDEVTSVGTKVAVVTPKTQSCDPNYSGACVPIASDVDCGGGSGNGPAYVYGTVRVIGTDIYGLDRDGDGYGCE